jgi:hypothetical protein
MMHLPREFQFKAAWRSGSFGCRVEKPARRRLPIISAECGRTGAAPACDQTGRGGAIRSRQLRM